MLVQLHSEVLWSVVREALIPIAYALIVSFSRALRSSRVPSGGTRDGISRNTLADTEAGTLGLSG